MRSLYAALRRFMPAKCSRSKQAKMHGDAPAARSISASPFDCARFCSALKEGLPSDSHRDQLAVEHHRHHRGLLQPRGRSPGRVGSCRGRGGISVSRPRARRRQSRGSRRAWARTATPGSPGAFRRASRASAAASVASPPPAQRAPSLFRAQPWRRRRRPNFIDGETREDRGRSLSSAARTSSVKRSRCLMRSQSFPSLVRTSA